MIDFTLNKIDEWKPCEFVNINPLDEDEFVNIYLTVDWETRFVTIEESEEKLDTSEFVDDVGISRFQLDVGMDFSKFEEYYYEQIRPLFIDIAKNFIVCEDDEDGFVICKIDDDVPIEVIEEVFGEIYDTLNQAPAHYLSLRYHIDDINYIYDDECGGLDKMLALDGIDLMNANLDNLDEVKKIRDAIETNCIYFVMDNEEFAEELEEIREEIRGD